MTTQQQTTDAAQVEIIVWNRQGATETHKGTEAECKEWFAATWDDPANLRYEIQRQGNVIASKPFEDVDAED